MPTFFGAATSQQNLRLLFINIIATITTPLIPKRVVADRTPLDPETSWSSVESDPETAWNSDDDCP